MKKPPEKVRVRTTVLEQGCDRVTSSIPAIPSLRKQGGKKKVKMIFFLTLLPLLFLCGACTRTKNDLKEGMRPQIRCPVMGGEIDRNIYVDVKGKRVYVCCRGCDDAISAQPDIYLKKLEKKGVAPEKSPQRKLES